MNRKFEKKPKYGMRKLSVGLCSVILGFGMFMNIGVLRPSNSQNTVYASDSLAGGAISNNSLGAEKIEVYNYGDIIVVTNLKDGQKINYTIEYEYERSSYGNTGYIEIKNGKILGTDGNFTRSVIKYNKRTEDKIRLRYTKDIKTLVLYDISKAKGLENITLSLPGGEIRKFSSTLFKSIESTPMPKKPNQESAPTTPKEPAPTTPKEPAPTTPKEPAPTTPKEPAPTTPKEPASTTPKEPAPTTPKEPAPTTPKEPAPTTPKEPAPTTPKEPAPTTPKEPAPTTPKEPAPTTPKEPAPTTPKEPAPTTPKEPAPTTPKEPAPTTPKEPAPTTPKEPAPTTPKEPAKPEPQESEAIKQKEESEKQKEEAEKEKTETKPQPQRQTITRKQPKLLTEQTLKYVKGSKKDIVVKTDAEISSFEEVRVGGKVLDKSKYEVKKGSIKITLKNSYLETLPLGTYELEIVSKETDKYEASIIKTRFMVVEGESKVSDDKKTSNNQNNQNPNTGDLGVMTSAMTAIVAGAALVATKKKKDE
ncbi:YSIRK-type signal peptide-containing protein [Helcococcus bovis]|uniref:YSIRK-type signal peptide-containing protein n=1 Tax=Helcococcus bovis TaxID=3153252 RepID=A0ABW9F5H3_9FIRM